MEKSLPVAVKFLLKHNKELSRNLSSYLTLAAIENSNLLAKHTLALLQSVVNGSYHNLHILQSASYILIKFFLDNFALSRVLPQIYAQNKEPIQKNIGAVVQVLHTAESSDQTHLLQLCALVAKDKPLVRFMALYMSLQVIVDECWLIINYDMYEVTLNH